MLVLRLVEPGRRRKNRQRTALRCDRRRRECRRRRRRRRHRRGARGSARVLGGAPPSRMRPRRPLRGRVRIPLRSGVSPGSRRGLARRAPSRRDLGSRARAAVCRRALRALRCTPDRAASPTLVHDGSRGLAPGGHALRSGQFGELQPLYGRPLLSIVRMPHVHASPLPRRFVRELLRLFRRARVHAGRGRRLPLRARTRSRRILRSERSVCGDADGLRKSMGM